MDCDTGGTGAVISDVLVRGARLEGGLHVLRAKFNLKSLSRLTMLPRYIGNHGNSTTIHKCTQTNRYKI